ncbi:phosphoserine phosphatase SerB [Pseudactinotalea sp. Z1748]|uniref:phosphoserine phosphatase SerB n=1 Tax=Pseudactinotalea sp. Z1748 TaxID=3413027 RepID=UPI003C7D7BFF
MSRRRLVVLDVDSTFIAEEQIDLLAAHAGVGPQVAAITERAMAGELDFAAALRERVAALAGLATSAIEAVRARISLSPGAGELIAGLHQRGWPVGLVSGGFHEIVDPLATAHGITRVQANRLETDDDGARLSGRLRGEIVDRATKADFLRAFAAAEGIDLADTVAIGDGANDLDMVTAAGLGVGYRPKQALAEAADVVLTDRLDELLAVLDR